MGECHRRQDERQPRTWPSRRRPNCSISSPTPLSFVILPASCVIGTAGPKCFTAGEGQRPLGGGFKSCFNPAIRVPLPKSKRRFFETAIGRERSVTFAATVTS